MTLPCPSLFAQCLFCSNSGALLHMEQIHLNSGSICTRPLLPQSNGMTVCFMNLEFTVQSSKSHRYGTLVHIEAHLSISDWWNTLSLKDHSSYAFFIDSAELAKVYHPITNYKDIQSRCFSWLIIRIQVRTSIGELYFVMADLNFVFLFRSNFRHSSRSHEAFTCCSIIVGNRVRRLHEYYQYILSSSCSWTTSFPR